MDIFFPSYLEETDLKAILDFDGVSEQGRSDRAVSPPERTCESGGCGRAIGRERGSCLVSRGSREEGRSESKSVSSCGDAVASVRELGGAEARREKGDGAVCGAGGCSEGNKPARGAKEAEAGRVGGGAESRDRGSCGDGGEGSHRVCGEGVEAPTGNCENGTTKMPAVPDSANDHAPSLPAAMTVTDSAQTLKSVSEASSNQPNSNTSIDTIIPVIEPRVRPFTMPISPPPPTFLGPGGSSSDIIPEPMVVHRLRSASANAAIRRVSVDSGVALGRQSERLLMEKKRRRWSLNSPNHLNSLPQVSVCWVKG